MSLLPANLLANLPDALWPASVTFQNGRTYANVSGLVSLDARVVAGGSANDRAWAIGVNATHIVYLRSYKSSISLDMRMVRGATYYNVLDVKHVGADEQSGGAETYTMTKVAVAITTAQG